MSEKQTPIVVEQSTDEKPQTDSQSATTQSNTSKKRKGGALAWVNFLLIIVLFALFGFAAWYALNNQKGSQSELAVLQDRLQTAQQQLATINTELSKFKQSEQLAQKQLTNMQKTVEFNSARLAKLPGAERQDWLLAEAEYLLRLANQRLQLEQDWQGALGLLTGADKVLLETRNPNVLKIRETISQEIMALKAVPAIDQVGLVLKLQSVQNRIPSLPWLPEKFTPEVTQDSDEALANKPLDEQVWYKKAWFSLRQSLSSMVRIRKREAPIAPALTANQRYYLQQNMQLMLEQAQLAVLRGESVLFSQSIERVENWVSNYIQLDNHNTQAIRDSLKALKTMDITPKMPNISQSLQQLQDFVVGQRRLPVKSSQAGDDA